MCESADKKLEFIDPDFETGDVVHAFLDLIVNFSIDSIVKRGWRNSTYASMYGRLCMFFDKYDCQAARRQLAMLFLYTAPTLITNRDSDSQAFFILGATYESVEMCCDAIRLDQPRPYYRGDSHLAPANMRYLGVLIPLRYRQALEAAWNGCGGSYPRERWALAFKREMEAAVDAGDQSQGTVTNQQQAT